MLVWQYKYGIFTAFMANKKPTTTSFGPENQPEKRRGKSFRTMVIDALKKAGQTEEQFIENLVEKAVAEGGVYLSELLKRYYPIPKQTHEPIVIADWPKAGTAAEKANVILDHIATGEIPPDLGALMIESISKSLGIEEITELAKRLEAIEKLLEAK